MNELSGVATQDQTRPVQIHPDRWTLSLAHVGSLCGGLLIVAVAFFALRGDVKDTKREIEDLPKIRERVRNLEESVRTITGSQDDTLKAVQAIQVDINQSLSKQ